ncbi:MAG: hypothetical protein P4L33_09365 [Capsulimonadaceae bacterium]|nr:hypothetical protein [Capsulimonadaceae bacterium]
MQFRKMGVLSATVLTVILASVSSAAMAQYDQAHNSVMNTGRTTPGQAGSDNAAPWVGQSNWGTIEPGQPGTMSRYFSADGLYPTSVTSTVDYTALANQTFTYFDLYRAKSLNLAPDQIVRAVALADWANQPLRLVLDRLSTGATFLQLAAEWQITPGWIRSHDSFYRADRYRDRVLNYIVAYETTGRARALAMQGRSLRPSEQVSPYFEEYGSPTIPAGGVQPSTAASGQTAGSDMSSPPANK